MLLRFAGSLLAAIVVVGVMLVAGLRIYRHFSPAGEEDLIEVRKIDMLDDVKRRELASQLGEDRPPPPPAPVRALSLPRIEQRERRGFVELEVSVGDDGQVTDVSVIDAFPSGLYERQAIDEVSQRTYSPALPGTTQKQIEIVEFSVPGEQD